MSARSFTCRDGDVVETWLNTSRRISPLEFGAVLTDHTLTDEQRDELRSAIDQTKQINLKSVA